MEKNQTNEAHHHQYVDTLSMSMASDNTDLGYTVSQQRLLAPMQESILQNTLSDSQDVEQKKPQCFGGCSNPTETLNWLDELNASSERTGKNIKKMAQESATDAVSAKLEFLLGVTLFHVRYEIKENGRWENSGRDLVELFDENKPGGERKSRYEKLKTDMEGAKVGMVFSEPTVFDTINYVQVFVNTGKTIEEYVVQFQGNPEDFARLYSSFSQSSDNQTDSSRVDYTVPLRFIKDVPLDVFVEKIESSYATEESRQQASAYLGRLKYDMAHLPKIDEYQKEAQKLAEYLEDQMLSLGISHAVLNMLAGELDAYSKGDATINTLTKETSFVQDRYADSKKDNPGVIEYYKEKTFEILTDHPGYSQEDISLSFQLIFDILDDSIGNDALIGLSIIPDEYDANADLQDLWIKKTSESLSIPGTEASLLLLTATKMHEIFMEQHDSMQLVEMLDVGHGALFFALDSFTLTEIPKLQNEGIAVNGLEYSDALILRSELSNEQMSEIYAVLLETTVLENIQNKPIEQQLKILQDLKLPDYATDIDLVHFVNIVEFIQTVDNSPSEQKIKLIKTEQKKALEKIVTLHQSIREMVTKQSTYHEKTHSYSENIRIIRHQSDETDSNEQDIHIENFSLALSYWMMVKLIQYVFTLQKMELYLKKHLLSDKTIEAQLPTSLSNEFLHEHLENVIQREPAPWLLFAIIWHMSMIREQGFAQSAAAATPASTSQISKKKKSNTQQGSIRIPCFFDIPTGVIYAFNHAMIEV